MAKTFGAGDGDVDPGTIEDEAQAARAVFAARPRDLLSDS